MNFSKKIPRYLLTKRNLVKLVVLTAVFSLFFINVFRPFDSSQWLPNLSKVKYFLFSSVLVLLGMAVVAISRVIQYHIYTLKNKRPVYWVYFVWIAAEIVAMSLLFCLFKIMLGDDRDFFNIWANAIENTAFILLLPYSVLWLYFSWDDKNKRLDHITGHNIREFGEDMPNAPLMTNFYDSKGEIKFSVKQSDLVYIQGADNYITVYYEDGTKISRTMIRSTLKQVEPQLREQGIIRCHRSYMVNTKRIKVLERKGDGFIVKLDAISPISVPISKNFVNDIDELFG